VIFSIVTDPAAWGAFLTGLGSVLAAVFSVRRVKKAGDEQCEQRIKDIKWAFKTGMHVEERPSEHP
jgi:hypothetical protein